MNKAARFRDIKVTGCIPCLLEGAADSHPEIHHLVEQAYRRGDSETYGACTWHHRGIPWPGCTPAAMAEILGPSLELNYKLYRHRYGTEDELLQVQNYLLQQFAAEPWGDYAMPRAMARKIREFWQTIRSRE